MTLAIAVVAYFAFYGLIAWLSERFSPLLAIGGLILVLGAAKMLS